MSRRSRVSARELRTVRTDPLVVDALQRYRQAARDWTGRIAVLEVQRDRDLARLEREIDDAEAEALSRLRPEAEPAPLPAADEPVPIEAPPARRRLPWRRRRDARGSN